MKKRSSEHNKQSLMNTNNLFLKKEMNISQFNNNNINKPLYDMPPKPINKDFLEVPNKTKENEFFLEKPKPKFSLDEIQKRTQDKITEFFFFFF